MGFFGKKEYEENTNQFTNYFNDTDTSTSSKRAEVDIVDDHKNAPAPQPRKQEVYPAILKLGDKGITQIASINKIAKDNDWKFSVEFPGNKVDMYFEGENYKIFCRGVDYSDENHLPTGASLADMIKKNTSSYDPQKYIFEKEQTMIASSQKMITEDDIKKLRVEASEIRKNLDGLIKGLENVEPKQGPKNIPVEEFGKKHKMPENNSSVPKNNGSTSKKTTSENLDATQKLEIVDIQKSKR